MKNILRVIVKTDSGHIGLEKQIDFTPSVGLILCSPITGTVGQVYYNGIIFIATMDTVIKPTDGKTLKHLKATGFSEYKL